MKPRHITFMLFQDCTDWCKAHGKTIGQLEKAGWTNTYSTASGCKSHFPCKNSKEPPRMGRLFAVKNRNHTALRNAFPA